MAFVCFSIVGCGDSIQPAADKTAQQVDPSAPLFTLLEPAQTGIQFSNNLTEDVTSDYNVLSFQYFFNGGGVAVGDINNDGLQDVLFTGNMVPNRLYINKGGMQFEDVTERAGLTKKNWSTGATMADVNNDGWQDIYICQAGPERDPALRQNLLYINQGDGTFTEEAEAWGVNDPNRSTQASFFDYDKDGDLDLYVMNEARYFFISLDKVFEDLKNKNNLREACGKMFRNNGNNTFTDVTEEAGMLNYGYGLGLVTADINQDGWTDVYVANDFSVPDYMYINNGDGTFTDQQKEATRQIAWYGMGADIADFNNDGWMDIAVVDMAANDHIRSKTLMASMSSRNFWTMVDYLGYQYQYMFNTLQLNNGPVPGQPDKMSFSNVANQAGVAKTDWSWAALLADFDNDGLKDYFVSNGFRRYQLDNDFRSRLQQAMTQYQGNIPPEVKRQLYMSMPTQKLANLLYLNRGELVLDEQAAALGVAQPSHSNGAAYADLDNDGDLDLLVNNLDATAFVYENTARQRGANYLQVTFETGARSAENLNVRATIYHGTNVQVVENTPVRGFQSAVGEQLHFGLGTTEKVDVLLVEWQDGSQLIIENPAVNTAHLVNKSNAKPNAGAAEDVQAALFAAVNHQTLGLNFAHKENDFDEFAEEVLLPHKQSSLGPFLATGDVDGNGLEDVFVGGATNQSGALFLQNANGFAKAQSQPWKAHRAAEDMGAALFDADGDGDLDLYVTSGGTEREAGSGAYQDRLYVNNGAGNFTFRESALPQMHVSTSVVAPCDWDGDGDEDLFVGGRSVPRQYPQAPRSFLLQNDGAGNFTDATLTKASDLKMPGLINAAVWMDVDGDSDNDLVLAGEWTAVEVYRNDNNELVRITQKLGLTDAVGWWYALAAADVNGDGRMDIVAGNVGGNTKFHPSAQKPLHIYSHDLDGNGSCDVVLSKDYKGQLVPTRGRQCSSEQMPFIKQKFPTYQAFAEASLQDIYTPEKLAEALHYQATEFHSMVFVQQQDGSFKAQQLPARAQISPVNGIVAKDFTGNGHIDLLLAGNMFGAEVETPRYDAGIGLLLEGDGTGAFTPLPLQQSGVYLPGDVKDIKLVAGANDGKSWIFAANNNAPLSILRCETPAQ